MMKTVDFTGLLPEVEQRDLRGEIRICKALVLAGLAGALAMLLSLAGGSNWHSDQELAAALEWSAGQSANYGEIMTPAEALRMRRAARDKFVVAHPEWREALR